MLSMTSGVHRAPLYFFRKQGFIPVKNKGVFLEINMSDLETYNSVFIEIFNVDKDELKTLAHHETAEWDSLTHMALIAHLEDKMGIMIEIDDIIDFTSYEKGLSILRAYGKNL